MPVRRGDDCLSRSKRDCQRTGDDLRLLPLRRDVHIRGANVLNQFFCAHKTIDEDQVR
jgi:hypothetical protein